MLSKLKDLLKKNLGVRGEDIAVDFLKKRGMRIVEKNFRTRLGEIDIIAVDKNIICFIEVKTRRSLNFGFGLEAVVARKQQKIMKTAMIYLKSKGLSESDFRFDVVSVLLRDSQLPQVEYLQNAFEGF